jgi:Tfp pilus assembly protein FimT
MTGLKNKPAEAGFSLVESAAVFLVIGIVVAIGIPAVSRSMDGYNLRSAATHLAERMSAVRAIAMEKNRTVSAVFQKNGQYGVDFNADGTIDTQDPEDPGIGYPAQTLPTGITFVESSFPVGSDFLLITFNSRGELPIGTVIPTGATGLGIRVQNRSSNLTALVNLRGKVWVE